MVALSPLARFLAALIVLLCGCVSIASRTAMAQDEAAGTVLLDSVEESADLMLAAAAVESDSLDVEQLLKRIERLEKADDKRMRSDTEKKSADAQKPTIKWSAELQVDAYTFSQDENSKITYGDIENGVAFRRARIAMFGDYGPSEYRLEMDFALPGRPSFLDVYGGFHDLPVLGRVRVGHFFEPFSLDRITSNRFVTFMERSLLDQAFIPARNTGIMANDTYGEDQQGTWGVGLFRADSDAWGDDVGDTFQDALTGRLTWLPWCSDDGSRLLHLGGAYSIRGTRNETARFRAQPEARLGSATPNVPFFVDTGSIPASYYQMIGMELAWVHGPLSLQSEVVLTPVNTKDSGTLWFQGWYAFASYFLTGEHRVYRKDLAIFDRVSPKRDFIRYQGRPEDKCIGLGPGAWEVAARISQLDLNDGPVVGGRLTDLTIDLNWYLTPYVRITSNYIHAFAQSSNSLHSGTDIFGTRFQYEF